jgi:hypothetical protein
MTKNAQLISRTFFECCGFTASFGHAELIQIMAAMRRYDIRLTIPYNFGRAMNFYR